MCDYCEIITCFMNSVRLTYPDAVFNGFSRVVFPPCSFAFCGAWKMLLFASTENKV